MSESKPTLIRYVGPSTEVYVPALEATVKRRGTVEVPTRALAKSLLEQDDNWAPVDDGDDKTEKHHPVTPAAGKED